VEAPPRGDVGPLGGGGGGGGGFFVLGAFFVFK
jgi:hypothetical protein